MTTLQGKYEFQNSVAERPGSAGEDGSQLSYEAEAERERKRSRPRPCKAAPQASGKRETKQTGVRNRKLAPGAKPAGIVNKAVQQSLEVVVIYVILDQ